MKRNFIIILAITVGLIGFFPKANGKIISCESSCPQKPYPISNAFSRGLQTVSLANFTFQKVAEMAIKAQISKIAQGNFDVNLDTYSAGDLLAGKFKAIEIKATDIIIQDMYISSLNLKSLCDFLYIDYNSKPAKILDNLNIGFNGVISEADLNKTVSTQEYKDKLSSVKLTFLGQKLISFDNPEIHIKNSRLSLAGTIQMPGFLNSISVPLEISSKMDVTNNKIKLNDAQISSGGAKMDLWVPQVFLDTANPVLFGLQSFEQDGRKINVDKLTITGDKLNIKGTIFIPKTK